MSEDTKKVREVKEFVFSIKGTATPLSDEAGTGKTMDIEAQLNGYNDDIVDALVAMLEGNNEHAEVLKNAFKEYAMRKFRADMGKNPLTEIFQRMAEDIKDANKEDNANDGTLAEDTEESK